MTQQQDYKSHQTSFESYMNHLINLRIRQKEQGDYLTRSLSVVGQSLRNPMSQLSETEKVEIIESCTKVAQSLSSGLVSKMKNVPVDLRILLEEIRFFFAEKIYKSKLTIDLVCSKDLNFQGDSLFIKFILLNVIGKSIHSVSKNGKVSILASGKDGTLELEIQDNGYSLADTTEGLIERYPTIFIKEDVFYHLCQDNGLEYKTSRAENGLNITKMRIPSTSAETLPQNVVQLFPS